MKRVDLPNDTSLSPRGSPPKHRHTFLRTRRERTGAALLSPQIALDALAKITTAIDSDLAELALLAPRRQRLTMVAWLARARAYQDALGEIPSVAETVTRIAHRLGEFSWRWWPGPINALRLNARPRVVQADFQDLIPTVPVTWSEAADLAEEALRTLESAEAAAGRDAGAWADSTRLRPPPRDPTALLAQLQRDLTAGWPLRTKPPGQGQPRPAAPPALVAAARCLRWLRDTVPDPLLWGDLAGRLRFWASRDVADRELLAQALDPSYSPEASWSSVTTGESDIVRAIRDLIDVAPVALTEERGPSWLQELLAFAEGDDLAVVARESRAMKAEVLALDVNQMFPCAERRAVRRRLQRLQKALELGDATFDADPLAGRPVIAGAVRTALVAAPEILRRTKGAQALFVSNRSDENLRERVAEILELGELEWLEVSARRNGSAAEAIRRGRYSFVLAATGFIGHRDEITIRDACVAAGVPYVRVNHGRPVAVLSALRRDLGL